MKLYLISITFLFLTLDYLFAKDPIVKTKYGLVRGKIVDAKFGTTNKKVSFYEGIRYGNAKRFSKPTPVEPWDNVYDATSYKSACYQFGAFSTNSDLLNHTNNKSEDCLFLNVWVPEHYKSGAVMVWIYGGGFQVGTIFTSTYDGRHLAAGGDVIVVSINYRLGPLGFLYGENESSAPGNVGLLDQILGLQWVHDNIALFGGDTNKITIFGESAGSMSVGALIISPLAKGLFHRAIMQSGAPTESIFISKDRALLTTKSFADKIGCSSNETIKSIVDCLRTKPVQLMVNATLTEIINGINFMPIYGDELLPIQTIQAMKLGKFNRNIDLMYGICKDEGTGFIPLLFPEIFSSHLTLTKDLVKKLIIKVLTVFMTNNSNINEVAEYYLNKLSTNATQDEFKYAIYQLKRLIFNFCLYLINLIEGLHWEMLLAITHWFVQQFFLEKNLFCTQTLHIMSIHID